MRKDGRLRKILAKTNVNFVFECTNLIDSFRVNWLTRIIHNAFSPTLDTRCPFYFMATSSPVFVDLIREDADYTLAPWVWMERRHLVRRRTARLKREVQEVVNEMQRTAAQQSERRRRIMLGLRLN